MPVALSAQTWSVDTLSTSDGNTIPLYEYADDGGSGPIVLLFHQGGASGRAEYRTIAPALAARGYRVATIDQRRGGDLFDGTNPVAARFDAETTSYCDVAPDLDAALDWAVAEASGAGVVLWGSSYSAALAILLSARRPDVAAAVLAFSPASGEPMDGCRPEAVAADLAVPWLVLRPGNEMEHEWIADQLEAFAAFGAETHIARPGRHGSSMLVEERVGASTDATWSVVMSFLERSLARSGR